MAILNAKASKVRDEPAFLHVQISMLTNRTIEERWSEELFTIRLSAYPDMWKIMFRFFKIMWILLGPEHKLPWFAVVLNVCIIFAHASVCGLNPCLLAPECTLSNISEILSHPSCAFALLNVVFIVPLVVHRSAFVLTWQQILRQIHTSTIWLMAFQFLVYLLCCLLLRIYASITEVSVLEGLLG
jgi:hypothetical protein